MKKCHIVFVSIAMLIIFSVPAVAADWELYGSARVGSWNISDVDLHNQRRTDSDSDIFIDYDPTTHIGFSVKSGDVTGLIEINPYNKTQYPVMGVSYTHLGGQKFDITTNDNGTPADPSDDFQEVDAEFPVTTGQYVETEVDIMRLCYGAWNFGAGEALVGKAYTPLNLNYSNSIFLGESNWGYGPIMEGRKPILQFKFDSFKIAVVKAETSVLRNSNKSDATDPYYTDPFLHSRGNGAINYIMFYRAYDGNNVDYDMDAPKIEVGYTLELGPATFDFVGSYLKFKMIEFEKFANGLAAIGAMTGMDLDDMTAEVRKEYDITSWLLGAGGKFDLNPVYINISGAIGLNPGSSESYIGPAFSQAVLYDTADITFRDTGNAIADTDFYSGTLVVGCKINDIATVEFGCGAIKSEAETVTLDALTVDYSHKYNQGKIKFEGTTYHFYLNAVFKLADGVYFVPEFGQQRVQYTEKQPGYMLHINDPVNDLLDDWTVNNSAWEWKGGPRGVGTKYFIDDYINYAGAKLQIDF